MASAHTVLSRDLHPGNMVRKPSGPANHEKRTLMISVGWLKPFPHASQIMVERGQQFPADLILIASSNEDGLAYIATADLDGYGLCARCGRLGQCGVSSSAVESTTCW